MASFCFDTCVATTLIVYFDATLRDLDQQLRMSELQTMTRPAAFLIAICRQRKLIAA